MNFVGIDLSDKHFDYCVTDQAGTVLSKGVMSFDDEGFHDFLYHCHQQDIQPHACLIGLENPHSRLVDFLTEHGFSVLLTHCTAIAKYRESRTPSKAKSDPEDAKLIADFIREHRETLRPIHIPQANCRELKLILEDRDKLVRQKVRFTNQLTNTLKGFFPEVLDVFGNITGKTALTFLERFDTLHQFQELSHQEVETFLDECSCYRKALRERILQMHQRKPAAIPEEVARAKALLKCNLVDHLVMLMQHIRHYEARIQELVAATPKGDIFQSLPGVDHVLGAKLLVLYQSRPFGSAHEVQSFCGTVPYTVRSGQSVAIRFRAGCHKFGRHLFHQLAYSSLRNSIWARKQFHKKRQEGKHVHHALRCVASLWVKITFAMWRDKKPYDEQRHLASIASHLLNQPTLTQQG